MGSSSARGSSAATPRAKIWAVKLEKGPLGLSPTPPLPCAVGPAGDADTEPLRRGDARRLPSSARQLESVISIAALSDSPHSLDTSGLGCRLLRWG